MAMIEDVRNVLEDFPASELRSPTARLDTLEKTVHENERRAEMRHEEVERRAEMRQKEIERQAEKRQEEVMAAIRQIINFNSISQRVARLESKEKATQH